MEYTALYRKYRPKNFNDVVGQNIIVDILTNSIKNGKISHAYLFSGPRGTGKTSIAKIFAKAVNCQSFISDVCDKCEMCIELDKNDIDIIEIDAASNNGVDEIREIRSNAKLLPSIAKYKVYIIDEVHMLSTGAFNALLKTLEEPPHHVIFILATTDSIKVPLTILSRCQRFDFKIISFQDIKNRLLYICKNEQKVVLDVVLNSIVEFSDGCLRDAINLLDQVLSVSKEQVTLDDLYMINGAIPDELIFNLFDCIIHNDIRNALQMINLFYENGKDFSKIVDKLLILVRNISINNTVDNYFTDELLNKYEAYKNIDVEQCMIVTNILNDLISELKKSTNQKILFELYIINIINKINNKNIEVINNLNNNIQTKEKVINNAKIINSSDNSFINNNDIEIKKNINNEFKNIRINNIFATADKLLLNKMLNEIDKISDFLSNKLYNVIVRLLLQGKLVVASNDYLLFTYQDETSVSLFSEKIDLIEKLFFEIYKHNYKVLAISESEWQELRQEYVRNIKNNVVYKLKSEIVIKKKKKKLSTLSEEKAIELFGEETVEIK